MLRKNFFFLAILVLGIGMIIRTFFGGNPNSNNPEIPQDTSTGFIAEISSTGNISDTGNIDIPEIVDKDFIEIKVMMPRYFYNYGRKKFAEDLYKNEKIYMNFVFVDNLNFYRDQLYDTSFTGADLFLFPYDWNEKVSTRAFSPQGNIESYFDPLLSPITQNSKISFMPFSADPMITYVISGYELNDSFYGISEFVLGREPIRSLSFPLFFGINSEDYYGNGFSREYQDIVRYALLHYFKTNNDSHDLQNRVDSNALQGYNMENLNAIANIITSPECKYFPSICFQIYNFVGLRFGFLSDSDIVSQYLSNKKSEFSSIQKLTMPFFQLESPVRIRGWGIRNSLEDPNTINGIYTLYKQYMNNYQEYNLRNSTLPVFRSIEGNGLIDNDYIGLRGYILQSGGDYMNTLKGINKFWELIEYQISANEYLR